MKNKILFLLLAIFIISVTIYSASAISVNNTYYEINCEPEESFIKYIGFEQICSYKWKGATSINKDVAFCFDSKIKDGSIFYFNSTFKWQNITNLFNYLYVQPFGKPYCYLIEGVTWQSNETKMIKLNYKPVNVYDNPKWDTLFGNKTSGEINLILDPLFNLTHYEIGTNRSSSYNWITGDRILNTDILSYSNLEQIQRYNISNQYDHATDLMEQDKADTGSQQSADATCYGHVAEILNQTLYLTKIYPRKDGSASAVIKLYKGNNANELLSQKTVNPSDSYASYDNITLFRNTNYTICVATLYPYRGSVAKTYPENKSQLHWVACYKEGGACDSRYIGFNIIEVYNTTYNVTNTSFIISQNISLSTLIRKFNISSNFTGSAFVNITFTGNSTNYMYLNLSNSSNISLSTATSANNKLQYILYLLNNATTIYDFQLNFLDYAFLNITFKNSDTLQVINQNISVELISPTVSYNYTALNGSLQLSNILPENYTMRYSATYFPEKFYFLDLSTTTYLTLYLTNGTQASNVTVTIVDESGGVVEGAIVKALRYDISTNSYLIDEIGQTNFDGETRLNLILASEFYKFIVEYPAGTMRKETNPAYLYSTSLQIQINTGETILDGYFNAFNVDSNLSFDETLNTFRWFYNDGGNAISEACLYVYTVSGLTGTLFYNNSCSSSTSGVLYAGVENVSGRTYKAIVWVVQDNSRNTIEELEYSFSSPSGIGVLGVFLSAIIILTVVIMFRHDIVMALIAGNAMLVFTKLAGLHEFDWWVIILMIMISIILGAIIGRNE